MSTSRTSFTFFTATTSLNNLPEKTAPWAPLPSHSMSAGITWRTCDEFSHQKVRWYHLSHLISTRMGFPKTLHRDCRRNSYFYPTARARDACTLEFHSSMSAFRRHYCCWHWYAWLPPPTLDSSCCRWWSRGNFLALMEGYEKNVQDTNTEMSDSRNKNISAWMGWWNFMFITFRYLFTCLSGLSLGSLSTSMVDARFYHFSHANADATHHLICKYLYLRAKILPWFCFSLILTALASLLMILY